MAGGVAFGIRDEKNFYVLQQSAIHDTVALDRYVHGVKRQEREEHVLTRGSEWHDIEVRVDGDRVSAYLDGRALWTESTYRETAGGIGLWARVTAEGCFQEAQATTGPAAHALAPRPAL